MQAPAVDLNPEDLFETDVAEVHMGAEMGHQVELASLCRRLENRLLHSPSSSEVLRELGGLYVTARHSV